MLKRRFSAGDTLIEVLFAVSVFSFVVVGSLTIMNQGTAASQRSLEITLVRQQIDAQAETLRFMHDSYVAVYQSGISFKPSDPASPAKSWYDMITYMQETPITSASDISVAGDTCPAPVAGSFVIDPRNVAVITATPMFQDATNYAQLTYNSNGTFNSTKGIWIEAIRSVQSTDSDQVNTGFIDFHIRACWPGTGSPVASTQGTIVRLYEPRG